MQIPEYMPYALAMASAMAAAVATTLARKIVKYCGNRPEDYVPVHYAIQSAILLPALPFLWLMSPTPLQAAVLVGLILSDAAANWLYVSSFGMQRAHRISTIVALTPVFAFAFSPLVPGSTEGFGAAQSAGLALIVAGLLVFSGELRRRPATEPDSDLNADALGTVPEPSAFAARMASVAGRVGRKAVLVPLAAAALMGLNALLAGWLFRSGAVSPYSYYAVRCMAFAVGFSLLFRPNFAEFLSSGENAKWTWIRGGAVTIQWLALLYAVSMGSPVSANAVASTTPLWVAVLAWFVWRTRMRAHEVAGMGIVVLGVIAVVAG